MVDVMGEAGNSAPFVATVVEAKPIPGVVVRGTTRVRIPEAALIVSSVVKTNNLNLQFL